MDTGAPHMVAPARAVRRLMPLVAWMAALGTAIGLLLLMGRGGLSTPSILQPSAWPAWASGRDPLEIAFAVLRLVGLAAAWYLVGVTTIGVVARLLRWGRLVDAADILTVPSVRRLLQAALGLGLAAAAVTGTTMGQVAPESPGAVVAVQDPADPGEIVPIVVIGPGAAERMVPVSPPLSTQVPPSVAAQALPPLPTQVPQHMSAPPSSTEVPQAVAAQVPQPVSAPAVPAQAQASQGSETYVVQHGDHLWGIAEETLAKAWGHPPTDAQIIPYWQHLIEVNRAALIDPGNPDLILPGQTFTVPSPPPSP